MSSSSSKHERKKEDGHRKSRPKHSSRHKGDDDIVLVAEDVRVTRDSSDATAASVPSKSGPSSIVTADGKRLYGASFFPFSPSAGSTNGGTFTTLHSSRSGRDTQLEHRDGHRGDSGEAVSMEDRPSKPAHKTYTTPPITVRGVDSEEYYDFIVDEGQDVEMLIEEGIQDALARIESTKINKEELRRLFSKCLTSETNHVYVRKTFPGLSKILKDDIEDIAEIDGNVPVPVEHLMQYFSEIMKQTPTCEAKFVCDGPLFYFNEIDNHLQDESRISDLFSTALPK